LSNYQLAKNSVQHGQWIKFWYYAIYSASSGT
jgi:hypothetical protein